MRGKLGKLLLALSLLLPMFLGFATNVNAANPYDPSKINITVHKLIFSEGELPALGAINNEGKVLTEQEIKDRFGADNVSFLKDAEFTIFDITDEYYKRLAAGHEPKDIMTTIQNENKDMVMDYAKDNVLQVGVSDADGQVPFTDLAKKDDKGRDKAFLIVETNQPTHVKQKAHPMVIITPVFNADGSELRDIHLYPKNEEFEREFEKTADTTGKTEIVIGTGPTAEQGYTVKYGDVIRYNIRTAVPLDLDKIASFVITDTPDEGLQFNGDLVIADLVEGVDYQLERVANGFKVTFFAAPAKATDKLKAHQGRYINLEYSNTVVKELDPDTWANNEAKRIILNSNNKEEILPDTGENFITGGYIFEKVDGSTGESLAGAKFHIVKLDENGNVKEWAQEPAADEVIKFGTDESAAFEFEVTAEGLLIIKGLEFSAALPTGWSYAVIETVPPGSGYLFSDAPIKFVVNKGSYTTGLTDPTEVINTKEGSLPSTGGMGIIAFIVFGAGMMAFTLKKYRDSHQEEV